MGGQGDVAATDYGGVMTEKTYTAVYLDGPLEGQTEERAFIDGKHDERFPTLGAVGGLESTFWYAVEARQRSSTATSRCSTRSTLPTPTPP